MLGLDGRIVIDVLVHVVVIVLALVHDELAVEAVDVAEVSRSAHAELPRPERDPVVGVESVRRIFSQIGRQDGLAAAHLITALLALAWHGRDQHVPGVQVPAPSRQAYIRPWHRRVLLPEEACEFDVNVPSYPQLLVGPQVACLVVILVFGVRPTLPHGVRR
jgi:hypothetical protein